MNATTEATKHLPIFVLARTPGATETVEWTSICQGQKGKDFVFVQHEPSRSPSRWTYAENKRPFVVYTRRWHKLGASSTLEGALKIAKRNTDTGIAA
jgi:hypothetical protein